MACFANALLQQIWSTSLVKIQIFEVVKNNGKESDALLAD